VQNGVSSLLSGNRKTTASLSLTFTSAGSFVVLNDGGAPIFDAEDYSYDTTDPCEGSFEISTGKDFDKDLHFVYGLATPTKDGSVRPIATVRCPFPLALTR
jgi:hypothetical protein